MINITVGSGDYKVESVRGYYQVSFKGEFVGSADSLSEAYELVSEDIQLRNKTLWQRTHSKQ